MDQGSSKFTFVFFFFLPGASEVWTSLVRTTIFAFTSISVFYVSTVSCVCQCHLLDFVREILMYGKVLRFSSNNNIAPPNSLTESPHIYLLPTPCLQALSALPALHGVPAALLYTVTWKYYNFLLG